MTWLTDRRILLIAPDRWGTMRVAKQNYALELARRNDVVYLERPDEGQTQRFVWRDVEADGGRLRVASYRPLLPLRTRFHLRRVHDLVTGIRARELLRQMGFVPEVVISFDAVLVHADLTAFGAQRRILMPMDAVGDRALPRVARTAEICVTVSPVIAAPFQALGVPTHVIDHGLSRPFADAARERLAGRRPMSRANRGRVSVGYSGNLAMGPVLDRAALRETVAALPDVDFHFWGPTTAADNNLGGRGSAAAEEFVRFLRARANVTLHGPVAPEDLVEGLDEVDALLVCYDVRHDPNRCSNSHKVIEYLSTGRPVLSSHLSAYAPRQGLLEMLAVPDNSTYARHVECALTRLADLCTPERAAARIRFALEREYARQIEILGEWLDPRRAALPDGPTAVASQTGAFPR